MKMVIRIDSCWEQAGKSSRGGECLWKVFPFPAGGAPWLRPSLKAARKNGRNCELTFDQYACSPCEGRLARVGSMHIVVTRLDLGLLERIFDAGEKNELDFGAHECVCSEVDGGVLDFGTYMV